MTRLSATRSLIPRAISTCPLAAVHASPPCVQCASPMPTARSGFLRDFKRLSLARAAASVLLALILSSKSRGDAEPDRVLADDGVHCRSHGVVRADRAQRGMAAPAWSDPRRSRIRCCAAASWTLSVQRANPGPWRDPLALKDTQWEGSVQPQASAAPVRIDLYCKEHRQVCGTSRDLPSESALPDGVQSSAVRRCRELRAAKQDADLMRRKWRARKDSNL
jgi:hypothetical protein